MNSPDTLQTELAKKKQFLSLDNHNPNLLADIADLHLQLGQYDEASQYIDQGLQIAPDHPALVFVKGHLAMANHQPDEAINSFEQLHYEVGTSPEVSYNLATCYLLKGDAKQAQTLLTPLVGEKHPYMPAHLLYAKACHHLGEMMDAITHIDDYLFHYPDHGEALGMLALVFLDLGDDNALTYADKALAINPDNSDALLVKATLNLNALKPEAALNDFKRVSHLKPTSGRANAGLGLIAMAEHDFTNAQNHLQAAVRDMPTHIGTWHALAWSQLFAQDIPAAKHSFEQALDIDHNFGETFGGLAVIAAIEGHLDEARTLSKKGLGLDSQSFSARYAQSLILAGKGETVRAEKMIEQILTAEIDEQGSLQAMLMGLQKRGVNTNEQ